MSQAPEEFRFKARNGDAPAIEEFKARQEKRAQKHQDREPKRPKISKRKKVVSIVGMKRGRGNSRKFHVLKYVNMCAMSHTNLVFREGQKPEDAEWVVESSLRAYRTLIKEYERTHICEESEDEESEDEGENGNESVSEQESGADSSGGEVTAEGRSNNESESESGAESEAY